MKEIQFFSCDLLIALPANKYGDIEDEIRIELPDNPKLRGTPYIYGYFVAFAQCLGH